MKFFLKYSSASLLILCSLFFIQCSTVIPINTTVYLVRHADKIEGSDVLSRAGIERANDLNTMLKDAEIEAIFSSDYDRTKDTAQPLATTLGLSLIIYDAKDIASLVNLIKTDYVGKKILVVGHSNTTPEAINEFGVIPQLESIPHDTYDRLYELNFCTDKNMELTLFHYGN